MRARHLPWTGISQSSGEANLTMTLIGNGCPAPSLGGFPLNAGASLALQISPPVAPATLPTAQVHVTGEMGFAGATFNVGRVYPVERPIHPGDDAHRKRMSCTQPGRV